MLISAYCPFLLILKSSVGEGSEEEPKIDFVKASECSLPPINPDKHLQNIMDCILPPSLDLLALEDKFETELQTRKAKTFGICPIRRQIYDQLFDELIRQVTINCAERGLMLLRVRDEIRLLESAIAYGIRKAILVERQQSEAVVERDEEKQKNADLTEKKNSAGTPPKQLAQERLIKEEEVRLLEQTMKDENERLLESNKTLKMHLQAILQMDQALQQSGVPATENLVANQKQN
uniref:Uncharacterized protein n=1 Tax=Ditylenchus dipsaci TaxID=166011 RepID=A0A915DPR0_9BILA